jgi:MarR family transcriptional regulator, organic hydroperoxide resistance regulator
MSCAIRSSSRQTLDRSIIRTYIHDVTRGSTLQKEIQQTKPFHSARQEAALALLRTADRVRRFISRQLDSYDLTFQQYNVLRILRGAGSEGLPTLEIANRMVEEAPGVTRLLDRLEAKRLVMRERCPSDRRQVLCYATPAALSLLAALDEPMQRADEEALSALSPAEASQLTELLAIARSGPL